MKRVSLHDKHFEINIEESQILETVQRMARDIHHDYHDRVPLFLCVLNGSFMFSSDLMKAYEGACEISFIRLSSYRNTETTGEVKTLIGLQDEIRDRDLIILEDIVDTGITISHLVEDLAAFAPRSVRIASLLLKPESVRGDIRPDYTGMEIPNDFIVGYGLDYNGLGRNLREIYKIVER